jgi:pimeloyl-ACP methyl ester carboxylesterase
MRYWSMMRFPMRCLRHLTTFVLVLVAGALPTSIGRAQTPDITGTSTFVILLDGVRVGTESVTIARTGDEWIVSGSGFVQPPLDLSTMRFETRYDASWQPRRMILEAALRGQPMALSTTFTADTASNAMTQGDQRASNSHPISSRPVVIPNNFFAAYESLAVRLAALSPGDRLPVYVPPSGETTASISQITPRRVSVNDQILALQEYILTIVNSSGTIPVEMWIDHRGRLARLVLPTANLVVIRQDLAHVLAREERLTVAGDDDVFIGATGFSLGATLTKPATPGRAPAVILVAGPGPQDRDYLAYGLPIHAHLAQALSSAGHLVVRYDPRGLGRSGGRAESSRMQEYADDVLSVVDWLRRRDDVDRNRIAIVGYGDAGAVAVSAARRTDRIAAVALINAPGRSGREVVLERQRNALALAGLPEPERTNRLVLQERIISAALTGTGWEGVPDDVRRQADTPWFRSWLAFDPAETVRRMTQPLLVIHGALDTEVSPDHARALEALGRARENRPSSHTRLLVVPGVNHLLVAAQSGAMGEYASLDRSQLSAEVTRPLVEWLSATMPARR